MKRNLRKYLSGMLSALLFVACILTPVNAHASSGLAVSAGKNFGDGVDTRRLLSNPQQKATLQVRI